ncbi:unnamed protein product [Gongylonema pulchrum]|uniref:DnaJ_C domain-containing protein n=1 Tax=Gongylonema pulchrum TaxID=637853 RepID=A0A183EMJ7_9BILA|nr:unnamed protein product [Gongylonema pulchrum]
MGTHRFPVRTNKNSSETGDVLKVHILPAGLFDSELFFSIFEKEEEDIFGLGQLLQSAKETGKEVKKRPADTKADEGASSKKRR